MFLLVVSLKVLIVSPRITVFKCLVFASTLKHLVNVVVALPLFLVLGYFLLKSELGEVFAFLVLILGPIVLVAVVFFIRNVYDAV